MKYKEHVSFKRGGDSKRNLEIGVYTKISKFFELFNSRFENFLYVINYFLPGDEDDSTNWRNKEFADEFLYYIKYHPEIVQEKILDAFRGFLQKDDFKNSQITKLLNYSFNNMDYDSYEQLHKIAENIWNVENSDIIKDVSSRKSNDRKYPEIEEAEEYLKSQGLEIVTTNKQFKNGSIGVKHPNIPALYSITGNLNVIKYPTSRNYESRPFLVFQGKPGDYMGKAIELTKRLNRQSKKYELKPLVSENLNEFVHPGVGGYSLEQLEKDFYTIIKKYKLEVEPEGAIDFMARVIGPAFDKGEISNEEDLQKIVIGNEVMPISEKSS